MNLLSKKIALFFVYKNKILAEEAEMYTYCFEVALSSIVNFSIIILGAIFTHRYIEVIPSLLHKLADTEDTIFLNRHDLTDWLPDAFIKIKKKINRG